MSIKYFVPLLLFVVPTVVGSAFLWPPEAMNVKTIGGFTCVLISAILTYMSGILLELREQRGHSSGKDGGRPDREARP